MNKEQPKTENANNLRFSVDVTDGNGLERNVTDNPNFKWWFADSKVVDDNGEPLVVYHGTNADFNIFDKEKFGLWDNGSKFRITGPDENGKLRQLREKVLQNNSVTVTSFPLLNLWLSGCRCLFPSIRQNPFQGFLLFAAT